MLKKEKETHKYELTVFEPDCKRTRVIYVVGSTAEAYSINDDYSVFEVRNNQNVVVYSTRMVYFYSCKSVETLNPSAKITSIKDKDVDVVKIS